MRIRMSSSAPRALVEVVRATALAYLLAPALLFGALSSGCCEVRSLGWARTYEPREYRTLRLAEPSAVAKARVLENGRFEQGSCNLLCGATSEVQVVACRPVAVAFPPDDSRVLVCDFGSGPDSRVRKTLSLAEAAQLGSSDLVPREACRDVCSRGDDEVRSCTLEPRLPPSPSPSMPFVACAYHVRGGCGDPVLSRSTDGSTVTVLGSCGGVRDPLGDRKTAD